jgi:hypothetical protein
MQAEDVSEQLTTIEEIFKMQSKIVEIGSKAEKSFRLHAAEQLRLT